MTLGSALVNETLSLGDYLRIIIKHFGRYLLATRWLDAAIFVCILFDSRISPVRRLGDGAVEVGNEMTLVIARMGILALATVLSALFTAK